MFQLTQNEWKFLRSQIATAKINVSKVSKVSNVSKVRYPPYVFTEHGVLMLSNVLNSTKAVNMSIQIIRVFDRLRKYAMKQNSKDARLAELHKLLMLHIENTGYKFSGYDKTITRIIQALNNLIAQPPKTRRIGFNAEP